MPRYHSPEYLEQAVKLVVEIGHPVDFVAEKLGVPEEFLAALVEKNSRIQAQSASKQAESPLNKAAATN